MKKSITKGIIVIGLLAIAGTGFALSGLLRTKDVENQEQADTKVAGESRSSKSVVADQISTEEDNAVVKEIIIDDIEKMNVPVYEYVEKVIIEGALKWFSEEPYEFGQDLLELAGGEFESIQPTSMAVDSKGRIYILDTVNNRIQKYDPQGKYIKSIPVESYKCGIPDGYTYEMWKKIRKETPLDTLPKLGGQRLGINIVIDSEDNLYYYMKRDLNTENPKGEVWKFVDDEVVDKYEVPIQRALYYEAPQGLILEDDGSIWLFITERGKNDNDKHFELRTKRVYNLEERKEYKKKIEKERIPRLASLDKEKGEFIVDEGKSKIKLKVTNSEGIDSIFPTRENIFIKRKDIINGKKTTYIYEYDYNGNPKKIIKGSQLPSRIMRKAWVEIDEKTGRVNVHKYVLKRIRSR